MRLFYITILLLSLNVTAAAQKQNNTWCFGTNVGIDFNNSPPTIFKPTFYSHEAMASVSDRNTGDLLFCTNGKDAYNAQYQLMPNGLDMGVCKDYSSMMGLVVVPFVYDVNKYYVFTTSSEASGNYVLSYSVVDMTLDGGKGDVVAGQKNILIDTGFSEPITVSEGCNAYWLLAMRKYEKQIYAYKITPLGITSTPVVSTYNTYPYQFASRGILKIAPDKKKLVVLSSAYVQDRYIAFHDFNNLTGVVSGGDILKTNFISYGCEFSANGRYLYLGDSVSQYDMSLPTVGAIANSRKVLSKETVNNLQRAADNNIYALTGNAQVLGRITNCNNAYPTASYKDSVIVLSGSSKSGAGFPQLIFPSVDSTKTFTKTDTTVCFKNGPVRLVFGVRDNSEYIRWQDGSLNDSLEVVVPGKYWVQAFINCDLYVDTFNVNEINLNVWAGRDTVICYGDSLLLKGYVTAPYHTLQWSTGDTTLTTKAYDKGKYTLTAELNGCKESDEIFVDNYQRISIELGEDVEICADEPLVLPRLVTSEKADTYLWQDGSTDRKFTVKEAGVYYVTVSNHCQTIRDTVTVTVRNCRLFFPDAFTPNGDGKNDIARFLGDLAYVTEYELHIFNRWGKEVFASNDVKAGWDGTHKGKPAAVDTYYYYIKYKYHGKDQIWKDNLILVR